MRAQKAVRQCLVFAQQAQQQVLRFYVRRAKLAGLVSCKKDYAPGFLGIPLKHIPLTQMLPVTSAGNITLSFWLRFATFSRKKPFSPASTLRSRGVPLLRRTNLPTALSAENLQTVPSPPIASSANRATLPRPGRDATATPDRSDGQTQG